MLTATLRIHHQFASLDHVHWCRFIGVDKCYINTTDREKCSFDPTFFYPFF